MYQTFELKIDGKINVKDFTDLKKIGEAVFTKSQTEINAKLESFLLTTGNFDAGKMKESWFPQINADIFLSHSHQDRDLALIIAGRLKRDLNLEVFIDSTVWGDSNKLLRRIDDELCFNQQTKNYDYNKRNYTTTHIHIMLASALNEMIYNSEAIFFLNTNNSTKYNSKTLLHSTESGWIYSEIKACSILEKRKPSEHKNRAQRKLQKFSEGGAMATETRKFEWPLDLSSFINISAEDYKNWLKQCNSTDHPLDTLYKLKSIIND